jgi:hypothetical protein
MEMIQSILSDPGNPLTGWAEGRMTPMVEQTLTKAPALVMAWIEKNPPGDASHYAAGTALNGLLDPATRERAAKQPDAPSWPSSQETAEWFLKLPQAGKDQSALETLIENWAGYDQSAAGEFLNRQPAGPDKDKTRRILALRTTAISPEGALKWAESISDESLRATTSEQVLKTWRDYDPLEAAAFESGAHRSEATPTPGSD